MSNSRFATWLAVLLGLGIAVVGLGYLAAPDAMAASFGLADWPQGDAVAFLYVKGIRDLSTGLLVFVLLLTGERRALGWFALTAAIVPVGDALIVLAFGGSLAIAIGVHALTAALVSLLAFLLLRERRAIGPTRKSAPHGRGWAGART